ncbi:MAG TPA: DNA/RNA nuclease SfsA [Clostridiaceae bacterium]|nr:DNA/RNA nuclease SfsA [Clostridiaceae bacterium]
MKFVKDTVKALFINRPDRFRAYVELEGEVHLVHVPNTGRNREILVPGTTVVLRKEDGATRKTRFSLIAGYKGDMLINIDSQIPNHVVEEALLMGKIPELLGYSRISREKTYGNSRFDFLLEQGEEKFFLEVKGVTLEEGGIASFPDAPTERGTKHVHELIAAKKEGHGAGILFLIQIEKVTHFTPAKLLDPVFEQAVKAARDNGVMILAYNCLVTENSLDLLGPVPVVLHED